MLMPLIIIVLFMVFYMCIYYHDHVVSKINAYSICIYEMRSDSSIKKKEKDMTNRINSILILGKVKNVKIEGDENEANFSMKLVCDIPVLMGGKIENDISQKIEGMEKRKKIIEYKIAKDILKERK